MAQNSKSDSAVEMANQLITIAGQFRSLVNTVENFNARNTSFSPDTYWRLMATGAANADGTVGTADGSPNLAHPITVGGIYRAEADLLQALTLLIEFDQFILGTLPTGRAAVNRRPTIDTVAG